MSKCINPPCVCGLFDRPHKDNYTGRDGWVSKRKLTPLPFDPPCIGRKIISLLLIVLL